jgi:hypothetical protein
MAALFAEVVAADQREAATERAGSWNVIFSQNTRFFKIMQKLKIQFLLGEANKSIFVFVILVSRSIQATTCLLHPLRPSQGWRGGVIKNNPVFQMLSDSTTATQRFKIFQKLCFIKRIFF